jgi:acyl carrier protein
MDRDAVKRRVSTIVGQVAPKSKASPGPETKLVEDLGYTSLALMDLAVALEKEFALSSFSQDEAAGISTVEDVQDVILQQLEELES